MKNFNNIEIKIQEMVDSLKAVAYNYGLTNSGDEARIITSIFLYKFLNDKYMYEIEKFAKEIGMTIQEIEEDETILQAFYDSTANNVAFGKEDTIKSLIRHLGKENFYEYFDDALERISNNSRNDIFAMETTEGKKIGLFEKITSRVGEGEKNSFAKSIFSCITEDKINFSEAYDGKFDFFARIFEYLIKDYNKDSGDYAEYFTPQSCARIMSKIISHNAVKTGVEVYDPSAGSGTLVMHLAHDLGVEEGVSKAMIYTQDLSLKSTGFLRINLLLNGLSESLHNVRRGDTLKDPAHFQIENNQASGLKRFDYVVSNPPFKADFSETRDLIEARFRETDRFFAGIPTVPKDKKKMPIYLMFIQHILYSLKDDGKAAIVVPNGFLTEGMNKKTNIANTIRKKLIEDNILVGVISMPSNIFANTGTNVSILFLNKKKDNDEVFLLDASNMGKKVKEGKKQRTVLSIEDQNDIINRFLSKEEIEGISVKTTIGKIKSNYYSFSPGHYFEAKVKHGELTNEEFITTIQSLYQQYSELEKSKSEIKDSVDLLIKEYVNE